MPVRIEPHAEPIPGYRLIEKLGSGGFGDLKLGFDRSLFGCVPQTGGYLIGPRDLLRVEHTG